MNRHDLTHHAAARKQQRGFPNLAIDWLLAYGLREPVAGGAVRIRFDRRRRKELERYAGHQAVSLMSKYLNAALIVDSESERIITVEWLH